MAWTWNDAIRVVDAWLGNKFTSATAADFLNFNPAVEVVIARACGGDTGVDPTFSHFYGLPRKIEPYLVIAPHRSLAEQFQHYHDALYNKTFNAAWLDCERKDNMSRDYVTGYIKDSLNECRVRWPFAEWGIYTAAWFWDTAVDHGWEADVPVGVAHYPYFVQTPTGNWRQAYKFEEAERCLPIDNNFTPRMPVGWKGIREAAWFQFSELGSLTGATGHIDLGWVKRSRMQRLYPEVPAPTPAKVNVQHTPNVTITTEVVNG